MSRNGTILFFSFKILKPHYEPAISEDIQTTSRYGVLSFLYSAEPAKAQYAQIISDVSQICYVYQQH